MHRAVGCIQTATKRMVEKGQEATRMDGSRRRRGQVLFAKPLRRTLARCWTAELVQETVSILRHCHRCAVGHPVFSLPISLLPRLPLYLSLSFPRIGRFTDLFGSSHTWLRLPVYLGGYLLSNPILSPCSRSLIRSLFYSPLLSSVSSFPPSYFYLAILAPATCLDRSLVFLSLSFSLSPFVSITLSRRLTFQAAADTNVRAFFSLSLLRPLAVTLRAFSRALILIPWHSRLIDRKSVV